MKRTISIGILVFSSLFGWLGQAIDKGNWIGGWSIFLGIIGAFVGIWVGYKIHKLYL